MATFEFNNPSEGSAYFFLETITTSSLYPEGTPKYMEGIWNVNGIASQPTANIDMVPIYNDYITNGSSSFTVNSINFIFTTLPPPNTNDIIYIDVALIGSLTPGGFASEANNVYNANYTNPPYDTFLSEITSNFTGLETYLPLIYGGTNIDYGNTIPYATNGVPGTFSGGEYYNFGLVTSSFIAGVVVQPGYSVFDFTPNITIPVDAIEFRGTGMYTVTITP